jgi:hypothetical protein
MEKEKVFSKKIIALITTIMILSQVFSPLGLFMTVSKAASTPQIPAVVIRKSTDIQTSANGKWFQVQFAFVGDFWPYMFDLKLKYDSTKIEPANKGTKKKATSLAQSINQESAYATSFMTSTSYLDTKASTFRLIPNTGAPENPIDYGPDDSGTYNGYMLIYTMTFRLKDESLTDDDLTADVFSLSPTAATDGFKLIWDADEQNGNPTQQNTTDSSYLKFDGFAEQSKTVTSIAVKDEPSKTEYDHGDTVNLAGGVITVTYSDNSTEDVSMTDPKVSIDSGSIANINNNVVKISYSGKTTTFNIKVNDPVDSLAVTSPMNTIEYSHGDNLDFTGLKLTATKRSGATEDLTSTSDGVSISENVASVNSNKFTKTSADGVVPIKGTQVITFSYKNKTADETIIVNDTISSVSLISQPTKTVYKRGEDLNLTGAKVKVLLASGNSTTINLPDGSVKVSNFDNTKTGVKQNLTVSFGGKNADSTIDVEAYNYIVSSEITAPTKLDYNYNTDLNLNGGKLTLVYKDTTIKNVNLTSAMISGYDKTKIGTQQITVTYDTNYVLSDGTKIPEKIVKTFEVEVHNNAQTIEITAPTKTTYGHGDSLSLEGGKIEVTYADGTKRTPEMTSDMVTETSTGSSVNMSPAESEYGINHKVTKNLTIKYEEDGTQKTATYEIEIINKITSIKMHTTPKTNYNVNDTLDVTNGEILVTRQTGEPEVKEITQDMVTGFDSSKENTKLPLKVTYTENGETKETSYDISVKDTVTSISIKANPSKTEYRYGESLDLTGATISVVKGSGTTDIPITDNMVSGYDPTTVGKQTVKVSYGGKDTTFEVTVKDYVKDITLTAPTKTEYKYGEALDLTGGKVQKVMASGAQEPAVDLTDSSVTVSGYNANKAGKQTITVEYEGIQKTFEITVKNTVKTIEITAPTKTTYGHGDTLSLEGGKIEVTYADGTKQTPEMTSDMVTETSTGSSVNMSPAESEYGINHKVTKNLTIKYEEDGTQKTATYEIEIINKITSIKMHTTPKTNYNVNDTLDVTNGEILVTRQTGEPEVKEITQDMVTGFDSSKENTKLPLKVTYTENGETKETSYDISVKDTVTSISIKANPSKTEYRYGESLDLTGATISVVKGSGTTDIPITDNMVSGYDPTTVGKQTVKVSYGGKDTTFEVTVKDYVKDITLTAPTKTEYKYGEALDLTGGKVQKVMASGAQEPAVDLTDSSVTVSGYNANKAGKQTITVEYEGIQKTFEITVKNTVKTIEITAPTKTTYGHGDTLSLEGGKIEVTYADGTKQTPEMTSDMVTETSTGSSVNMSPAESEYGINHKVTKNLTIKYEEDGTQKTATYEIEIINKITSIKMHTTPKTNYNVNDTLDVTNGEILVTRQTGEPEVKEITQDMVTGFDSSKENTKLPLKVTYTENGETKETSYDISVKDTVTSISIKANPSKTEYRYGESLDLTGATISVVKGSGTTDIPITDNMVSGYDPTTVGKQTVKVSYGGKDTTFEVTVKDYVKDITLTAPTKTEYKYGEALDLTGGKVQKVMASGAQEPAVDLTDSSVTVSGYNANKAGKQTITVEYEGIQKTFEITVVDPINKIELKGTPKTEYKYGEEFDVSNLKLSISRASGETEIPVTSDMIKNYNKNSLGQQQVTIEYEGNTIETITVQVVDYIQSVVITPPSKVSYNYGETLDLTGAVITKVMASTPDEPITINVTNDMISGYNPNKLGIQDVTITYTDGKTYTQTFKVTVNEKVKSISLKDTGFKKDYKYGENLDLDNLSIVIQYISGKTEEVPVTSGMVTGYDPKTLGNQALTIKYDDFEVKTSVSVKDYIKDIKLTPPDKKEYKINESLSLAGGSITEVMASGATGNVISLIQNMVSGFDSTTPGTKTITVKYKEITKQFQVAVVNNVNHIEVIPPTKTEYKYGENLNLAGSSIKVVMEDGTTQNVNITKDMVSGYNKTKPGQQMITVKYTDEKGNEFTGYFSVTVGEDYIKELKFNAPTKRQYRIGDSIDLTGGYIAEVYASGKLGNKYELTNSMISGFDSTTPGTKTIKVKFEDNTYTYTVNVQDRTLGISIKDLPNKTVYKKGESLDLTGATLNVIKDSGVTVKNITNDMVSGFDKNKEGYQVITVSYEGFKVTFGVTVQKQDKTPVIPASNKPSNSKGTKPSGTTKVVSEPVIDKQEDSNEPEQVTKDTNNNKTNDNKDNNKNNDSNKDIVKITKDEPQPNDNDNLKDILSIIAIILGLAGITLIIIVVVKCKKNVKIYLEEAGERALIGKERLTKDDRTLNLNKYYEKYKEDEYKIVLSKSISKKLDQEVINVVVNGKNKAFKVNYEGKKIEYII